MASLRNLGVSASEYCAGEAQRRTVTEDDIRWALANEGRMGLQAMAKIRGVNREALKAAIDAAKSVLDATIKPPPAKVEPPRPARNTLLMPGSILLAILKAIADGCDDRISVAQKVGSTPASVASQVSSRLHRAGLVRMAGRWTVTAEGWAELGRHGRRGGHG
jgi:hypothetical protein